MGRRKAMAAGALCALTMVCAGNAASAQLQQQQQEGVPRPKESTARTPAQNPQIDQLWQQINLLQMQILDHELADVMDKSPSGADRQTARRGEQPAQQRNEPSRQPSATRAETPGAAPDRRAEVERLWQQVGELHQQIVTLRMKGSPQLAQAGRQQSREEAAPREQQPREQQPGLQRSQTDPMWKQIGQTYHRIVEREVAVAEEQPSQERPANRQRSRQTEGAKDVPQPKN